MRSHHKARFEQARTSPRRQRCSSVRSTGRADILDAGLRLPTGSPCSATRARSSTGRSRARCARTRLSVLSTSTATGNFTGPESRWSCPRSRSASNAAQRRRTRARSPYTGSVPVTGHGSALTANARSVSFQVGAQKVFGRTGVHIIWVCMGDRTTETRTTGNAGVQMLCGLLPELPG